MMAFTLSTRRRKTETLVGLLRREDPRDPVRIEVQLLMQLCTCQFCRDGTRLCIFALLVDACSKLSWLTTRGYNRIERVVGRGQPQAKTAFELVPLILDPRRDFGKNPSRSTTDQTPTRCTRCEDFCDVTSNRHIPQSSVSDRKRDLHFNRQLVCCSYTGKTAYCRTAGCFTIKSPREDI